MDELFDRVVSLGPQLLTYDPKDVTASVIAYLGGKSVYAAARDYGIPEQRLRRWIKALDVRRSDEEANALRRAAGQAANRIQSEQRRASEELRRALLTS